MKRIVFVLFLILWIMDSWLWTVSYAQQETLTIITYYPAPYGAYRNIRTIQDASFATDSGNVGIGTTGPTDKLHVVGGDATGLTVGNGTLRTRIVINSNIWPELRYQVAGTEYWRLGTAHAADASYKVNIGDWYIYDNSTNQMAFILRNDNGGTILSPNGGNVGIGVTSPNATLSVNGSISRAPVNNKLYGKFTSGHVNLGENSTTGISGQDYIYCTVSGGYKNTAGNAYATVGGGNNNTASKYGATVRGGYNNTASGDYATVVGGGGLDVPNVASGSKATIGGGDKNTASGTCSFVGGGSENTASNPYSTVGGGDSNTAGGDYATVLGGTLNTAMGAYAAVAGGRENAANGNYSFAAGYGAVASNQGCFVWASPEFDAEGKIIPYGSNADNQFRIRASGGVWFGGTQQWDIAEFMDVAKDEGVSECEIVSIKSNDRLGKSTKPYDKNLIGIVSSKKTGTLFLAGENPTYNDTLRMPITLAGRAYVKVNNENGQISIGDPVTSSSQAGIGMKATKSGKIIGYAMENQDNKEDTILVYINIGYYTAEKEILPVLNDLERRMVLIESEILKIENN